MTLRLAQYTVAFLLIWYHLASMVATYFTRKVKNNLLAPIQVSNRVVYRKPYLSTEFVYCCRDIESLSKFKVTMNYATPTMTI